MAKQWRRHTEEFKRQVVERMKTSENIGNLARELNLQRKLLYTWKYQFEGRPEARHANYGTTAEERKENRLQEENEKLKKALAERIIENDFFARALLRIKEGRQPNSAPGVSASTQKSGCGRKSKAH